MTMRAHYTERSPMMSIQPPLHCQLHCLTSPPHDFPFGTLRVVFVYLFLSCSMPTLQYLVGPIYFQWRRADYCLMYASLFFALVPRLTLCSRAQSAVSHQTHNQKSDTAQKFAGQNKIV